MDTAIYTIEEKDGLLSPPEVTRPVWSNFVNPTNFLTPLPQVNFEGHDHLQGHPIFTYVNIFSTEVTDIYILRSNQHVTALAQLSVMDQNQRPFNGRATLNLGLFSWFNKWYIFMLENVENTSVHKEKQVIMELLTSKLFLPIPV